jgi:glycosyltransferase involved in cell wall biosynthesis
VARVLSLARAVAGGVRAWRPDVLLSVLPQSDVACALVARRAGVPWVAMVHGRPFPAAHEQAATRREAWRTVVARAYRGADRVLAVSGALAAELDMTLGVAAAEIIPTGVRIPATAPPPPADGPAYGFVGRLAPEKDPGAFLAAARELPGHPAHLFGDGPLRPAEPLGPGLGHVTVHGWTDRERAYAALDVVLIPSRREALGLTCLEAGARRRCVVASAVGGLQEVLGRDPVLAERCLVPAGASPAAWRDAVAPLLADAGLRASLAGRLHAIVAGQYGLARHVDALAAAISPEAGARVAPVLPSAR